MNAKEFFDAVSRMRELQREYWCTRDEGVLAESITQMRLVDDEIERVKKVMRDKKYRKAK